MSFYVVLREFYSNSFAIIRKNTRKNDIGTRIHFSIRDFERQLYFLFEFRSCRLIRNPVIYRTRDVLLKKSANIIVVTGQKKRQCPKQKQRKQL